ncbi:MAG TPA: hypothetical protein VLA56_04590, partial [Pseudomonadales bacterium]|nr:hypothetical protein [Pseudomonadales bacterium]
MKVRILAPEGRGTAAVFVRCPRHLEDLLAAELVEFGLGPGTEHVGGIEVSADLRQAAMICLRSRIASRVLWPLAAFTALDADALYEGVSRLRWDAIVRGDATLAVGFDGTSSALRHTGFAARRVKDAVVDVLRTV